MYALMLTELRLALPNTSYVIRSVWGSYVFLKEVPLATWNSALLDPMNVTVGVALVLWIVMEPTAISLEPYSSVSAASTF